MCTGIRLMSTDRTDRTVVHARTMEFAVDPRSEVVVYPRGYTRTGTTPNSNNSKDSVGHKWTAKYASVGANGLGLQILVDGVNEKGLAVGLFYFPGSAGYMPWQPSDSGKTIAPWELPSWILDQFESVGEVKANIGTIVVPEVVLGEWGFAPGVHFVVHDRASSIVIEFVGGECKVHDNPLGVITNSPTYDWHMTNLRNYLNFSIYNASSVQLGPVTLEPFGQGSGMLGMPGDFTPPSRFVRAVAFVHSVAPELIRSGHDTVLQAFHILNNFDIPRGAAREHEKDEYGNILADYTIWTTASDLKAKRYYFRTYENSQIRMVDLMKHLTATKIIKISMKGDEVIKEMKGDEVIKPLA